MVLQGGRCSRVFLRPCQMCSPKLRQSGAFAAHQLPSALHVIASYGLAYERTPNASFAVKQTIVALITTCRAKYLVTK